MVDITLCTGVGCPLSDKCYRANAIANPDWQSYFVRPPYKDGKCDELWEMKNERK